MKLENPTRDPTTRESLEKMFKSMKEKGFFRTYETFEDWEKKETDIEEEN